MKDLWLLVIKLEEVAQSLNPKPPFDRWGDQGIEKRSQFQNKMGKWTTLVWGPAHSLGPSPTPTLTSATTTRLPCLSAKRYSPHSRSSNWFLVWQLRDSRVHIPESEMRGSKNTVSQDQRGHSGSVMSKIYITQSWLQLVFNLLKSHFCFLCVCTKLL